MFPLLLLLFPAASFTVLDPAIADHTTIDIPTSRAAAPKAAHVANIGAHGVLALTSEERTPLVTAHVGRVTSLGHQDQLDRYHGAETAPEPVSALEQPKKSFLKELKDSLVLWIVGLILFVIAFPILWLNERNSAEMEAVLHHAKQECVSLSPAALDGDNDGILVHLTGRSLVTAPLKDPDFSAVEVVDSVRLRRTVEMYQWVETGKEEERGGRQGERNTVRVFQHTKEWKPYWVDSAQFQDVGAAEKYRNPGAPPCGFGVDVEAQEVKFGAGDAADCEATAPFRLSTGLVAQLTCGWEKVATPPTLRAGGMEFSGGLHRAQGGAGAEPGVGDVRVSFEHIKCGPTTVMALQDGSSFLPYRAVSRGAWCFGDRSAGNVKKQLLTVGRQSPDELIESRQGELGNLACCCCLSNTVEGCCAAVNTPQIEYASQTHEDSLQVFRAITASASMKKWLFRAVGWLVMYLGQYLTFAPLITLFSVIPFINKLVATSIFLLCGVTTALVSLCVAGVACLVYHPRDAMLVGLGIATVVALGLTLPTVGESQKALFF